MAERRYTIRWSFLFIWLIGIFALALYTEFSIPRFVAALIASICWCKIAIFLDKIEAEKGSA